MRRILLSSIAALLLLVGHVNGQSRIGIYGFAGATGSEPAGPVNSQPANATFLPVTRMGLTANAGAGTFNSSGWSQNASPDLAKYITFGVKANPGFKVSVDSVKFLCRRSNSGPNQTVVRTSVDNYAADFDNFTTDTSGLRYLSKSLNIGGGVFANKDSVVFRFHGFGATAAAGTWRIDSIVVVGSIAASGPYLTVSPSSLNFGAVNVGTTSTKTYTVSGGQLTDSVLVVAPASFTISVGGGPQKQQMKLPLVAGSINETVSLTFAPQAAGAANGVANHVSGSLSTDLNITAAGTTTPARTWSDILPYKSRNATTGVADSVGKTPTVRGVVYGVNTYNPVTGGVQFTIIDPTAGINVRMQGNTTYTVTEGDSVEVTGAVAQFRGLIQINATAITRISGGSRLKSPTVLTAMGYPYVSDLVRFNDLKLVAGTWPATPAGSGFTAKAIRNATGTDTVYIRVIPQTADVWTMAAPSGNFDLIGLGGQFASPSTSSLGGLQVSPRRMADFVTTVTPPVGYSRILPYKSRNASTGVADSIGKTPTVRGVVYGVNTYNPVTGGVQFTIIDPTAGINVRMQGNTTYTVTEGDSVEVTGTVAQFRGLIQINATAITLISGGSRLKSPRVLTAMDYPYVSDLVRFNNLSLVAGTWPAAPTGSGFTAKAIRNATGTDTVYIRVIPQTADVWTMAAPSGNFDLIGLGGQFASPSTSALGGFQVSPRRMADFITTVTPPAGYSRILPYKSRNSATGVADSLTKIATVRGVVYGVNTYNPVTGGVQFTIIDPTAGINVRMQGNTTYTVTEGDSVEVTGAVAQFRGLIQINATAITLISANSNLKAPTVLTAMDYPFVSDLVRFNNLSLVAGTWPATPTGSGFTAKAIRNATGTDTVYIRVVPQTADVWALPAPSVPFDLIAIGGQFASPSTSALGGFQVSPRRVADIIPIVGLPHANKQSISAYPNPTSNRIAVVLPENGTATLSLINVTGQTVKTIVVDAEMLAKGVELNGVTAGVYQLNIIQGNNQYISRIVKQ